MSHLNLYTLWAGFLGLRGSIDILKSLKGAHSSKRGSADLVVTEAGQVSPNSREPETQGLSFGSQL